MAIAQQIHYFFMHGNNVERRSNETTTTNPLQTNSGHGNVVYVAHAEF